MLLLFIKSKGGFYSRISLRFVHLEIENVDNVYRQESIILCPGIHLSLYLKGRIIYRSFRIERLLPSLDLHYNSGTIVCLAEHVIDRTLAVPLHCVHLLVHEVEVYNLPVGYDLIQELNHHIFTGLLSKDQLEHIIVKEVSILEKVRHNSLNLNVSYVPISAFKKTFMSISPSCPHKCAKKTA